MAFIASGAGAGQEWKTADNATNYIDMLEKVRALLDNANNSSVVTASFTISVAGTGYAVGDFVQLVDGGGAGGPQVFPAAFATSCSATFEVTTISGGGGTGPVTAVRIRQSGCYATTPTNVSANVYATAFLTGAGTGLQIGTISFAGTGWVEDRISQEVTAVVPNAAGTGYTVNDVVTLVSDSDSRVGYTAPQTNTPATFTVSSISGGGGTGPITGLTLTTGGVYHRFSSGLTGLSVTGGTGASATVDVTLTEFGPSNTTTDREMIMTSTGGFPLGIRTFTDGVNVRNWELMGMQTYVAANDWDAQINRSPGRYPDNDTGAYAVLENDTFPYWMTITDRYISIVFNIGVGIYSNMFLGAFDQFGTTAQYPQPIAAVGCSSRRSTTQTTGEALWAGMNLAIAVATSDADGPAEVLTPGGGWVTMRNGHGSGANIVFSGDFDYAKAMPGGNFEPAPTLGEFEDQDIFIDASSTSGFESWRNYCGADDPSTPSNNRKFTAMGIQAGTALPAMFEVTLLDMASPTKQVLGEFSGLRQVEQTLDVGTLNSEDCIDDGTNYWYVFANCRLDRTWSHFTMRGV